MLLIYLVTQIIFLLFSVSCQVHYVVLTSTISFDSPIPDLPFGNAFSRARSNISLSVSCTTLSLPLQSLASYKLDCTKRIPGLYQENIGPRSVKNKCFDHRQENITSFKRAKLDSELTRRILTLDVKETRRESVESN